MAELMPTITGPTTHRHKVGTCPACRSYLWAEVDVLVKVTAPTIAEDGKAHVYATPQCVAMRVNHECSQDAS